MKIIKLQEGVRKSSSDHVLDMTDDHINDLINTVTSDELYFHLFDNNSYYFGYKFNETASRKHRSEFIAWLKSQTSLTPELESFIIRPIKALKREFDFNDFGTIVYPKSERSNLTNLIINCITNISSRDAKKVSVELIKELPQQIQFDFDALKADKGIDQEDKQFQDIKKFVDSTLLPAIHDSSYFSIADSVKPKYRKYIRDYLKISDRGAEIIKKVTSSNILIVDDINTSGSTLREIIRIIRGLNSNCNIFIYTLIGR